MDFRSALKISIPKGSRLSFDACRAVQNSFHANARRVIGILEAPGLIGWFADAWGKRSDETEKRMWWVDPTVPDKESHRIDVGIKVGISMAGGWTKDDDLICDEFLKRLAKLENVSAIVESKLKRIRSACDDILKSAIIQAWIAFEVMAEDLLIKSMQIHPECFAAVKVPARFRSRGAILESYRKAFDTDSSTIEACIDNENVDALALIRNVLVHADGKADRDFRAGAATCAPLRRFRHLQKGDPLFIDGRLLLSIVDPAMENAYRLIEAVDAWLTLKKPI